MKNICAISLKNKVSSFVLFSTVSVYGHPEPDELPVKEDNVKRPGTNYERSKLMQEEIGLDYVKKGLPVAVVRPAPVYGPRNTYGMATILFLLFNIVYDSAVTILFSPGDHNRYREEVAPLYLILLGLLVNASWVRLRGWRATLEASGEPSSVS